MYSTPTAIDDEYAKWDDLFELIKKIVDIDIWFYDLRKQRLTANSQTTRKAFARL